MSHRSPVAVCLNSPDLKTGAKIESLATNPFLSREAKGESTIGPVEQSDLGQRLAKEEEECY